jgi:peptidoglycan/xylan/chitin deacetylase (PgdA/CDA1 family)
MAPRTRKWRWPNDAKVAVTIGLAFEGFHNYSQFRTYNPEQKVNHFSLSYADYGWKAGAWRLLALLDKLGLKGQVYTNGFAAEQHPEVVAEMARAGRPVYGR